MFASDITELVGHTPMVYLNRISGESGTRIAVKLEQMNPQGSVKDRIAVAMINKAEHDGILKAGGTIVEPTSGNTGIGLAFVAAVRGYHTILTMPDSMSMERRALLSAFGAELILTPAKEGMQGAIDRARDITENTPGAFMPQQFKNEANPQIHFETTGVEIWNDTNGEIDVFVAGVGTGGTITGVGRFIKNEKPSVKIIAVEPSDSPVLSGGKAGPHKIQGIGAGFVPHILDHEIFDDIVTVQYNDAQHMVQRLAREEGILSGISSGANVFAALEIAQQPEYHGKLIITVICDRGERYLSTDLF